MWKLVVQNKLGNLKNLPGTRKLHQNSGSLIWRLFKELIMFPYLSIVEPIAKNNGQYKVWWESLDLENSRKPRKDRVEVHILKIKNHYKINHIST